MRAFVIALLLFFVIGIAGATNPVPTFNFGPDGGLYVPGVIKTPYVTVDHDVAVAGDVTILGSATITGGYIASGVVQSDLTINNPYTLRMGTGAASVDFGRATGAMKGVAGTTYLNVTMIGAGKATTMGGTVRGNAIASNTTIVAGSSLATITTAKIGGAATVNSLASNGTIVGGSSLALQTTAKVGGLASLNSLKVNTSLVMTSTASATNDTLTSASTSQYFVGAAAGQRIILPAVSGNTGLKYTFSLVTGSTGSHHFVLDGSGAETINGVAALGCATQYASISVVCTGTEWVATSIGNAGTWASYSGTLGE